MGKWFPAPCRVTLVRELLRLHLLARVPRPLEQIGRRDHQNRAAPRLTAPAEGCGPAMERPFPVARGGSFGNWDGCLYAPHPRRSRQWNDDIRFWLHSRRRSAVRRWLEGIGRPPTPPAALAGEFVLLGSRPSGREIRDSGFV